jgi:hypothetical protein
LIKIGEKFPFSLFQGFVGEDMPSDADGKCDEKKFYPDGIANGYRAIG